MSLTSERLREILCYEPDSGVFTRLCGNRAGRVAGSDCNGYVRIRLDSAHYYAHRLAWLYMTGRWPGEIDHINRDPGDNRWTNLREVDRAFNQLNRGLRKDSPLGVEGVRVSPHSKKRIRYLARLSVGRKDVLYKQFDTIEEASAAYQAVKRALLEKQS